jgi:acyl-coenzyme A thioesterase PaaI-like protein
MALRPFPSYPACPVCGDPAVNPATLGVTWAWDTERGAAVGRFTPGPLHTGYAGVVHGGLISALLDECLAWACAVRMRAYCMTGELDVRFTAPASIGEALELCAWSVHSWGRYVRAQAEARSAQGELLASATATFVAMEPARSAALHAALRLSPGDYDVLGE